MNWARVFFIAGAVSLGQAFGAWQDVDPVYSLVYAAFFYMAAIIFDLWPRRRT